MLERPDLDEAALVDGLRERLDLEVSSLTFLPLGNDSAAWTYRARAVDATDWLVKVRREIRPAAIRVPPFLHDHGLPEVVAPRRAAGGDPALSLGDWSVAVYPFIEAPRAMDVGLGLDGWRALGSFAARLHGTVLPPELAALLPREDFRPKPVELAESVGRQLDRLTDADESAIDEAGARVAAVWNDNRPVIDHLIRRVDRLGRRLRDEVPAPAFVVCHADLHIGNVLVDDAARLAIIDWDEVMLAPPERDLMFVRDSPTAGIVSDEQASAFEIGYGSAAADPVLIAYYRIDWAIHDLADFARRVVADPSAGPATRARAVTLFEGQFEPGGQVEAALRADERIGGADAA